MPMRSMRIMIAWVTTLMPSLLMAHQIMKTALSGAITMENVEGLLYIKKGVVKLWDTPPSHFTLIGPYQ